MDKYDQDFKTLSQLKLQIEFVKKIIIAIEDADKMFYLEKEKKIKIYENEQQEIKKKAFELLRQCLDIQIPKFKNKFFKEEKLNEENDIIINKILNYWYSEEDVTPFQKVFNDLISDDLLSCSKLVVNSNLEKNIVNFKSLFLPYSPSKWAQDKDIGEIITKSDLNSTIAQHKVIIPNAKNFIIESIEKYNLTMEMMKECNLQRNTLFSYDINLDRIFKKILLSTDYIPEKTLYNANLLFRMISNQYRTALKESNFYKDILVNNIDDYLHQNLELYFEENNSIYSIDIERQSVNQETILKILTATFNFLSTKQKTFLENRFKNVSHKHNNLLLFRRTYENFLLNRDLNNLKANEKKTKVQKV